MPTANAAYIDYVNDMLADAHSALAWLHEIERQMLVMMRCEGYKRFIQRQYMTLVIAIHHARGGIEVWQNTLLDFPDYSGAGRGESFEAWLAEDEYHEQRLTDSMTHAGCVTSG